MKPFIECSSVAAVIDRDNVDTDMIIRIERMTTLKRGQFGPWLFEMLRYQVDGMEDPSFVLNRLPFRHAQILITGNNFGCGSSREMAVWALQDFGIRCVIAPSYGDIFYNNCLQNGVLPIRLGPRNITVLVERARAGQTLHVDLKACLVKVAGGASINFNLPRQQQEALLSGQDEIDLSMALIADIAAFQLKDRQRRPWVYNLDSVS